MADTTNQPVEPLLMLGSLARMVALELNTVDDDDERERLHERFETVLNDELFHGAANRGC